MIKELIKNYLWLLPFLFFFVAFFISFVFFSHEKRIVPSLLHLTTPQALSLLADQQLNCRLLKEQESTWGAGTIIAQSPAAGKSVKAFQTIFITVAKPIAPIPIPRAVGLSRAQVASVFNSSYTVTWYPVYSSDIHNKCIGQINNEQEIILYESCNTNDHVIMPSFHNKNVIECKEFLTKYGISAAIFHSGSFKAHHTCTHCSVIEQSPAPGTIISLTTPPIIQLKI